MTDNSEPSEPFENSENSVSSGHPGLGNQLLPV